MNRKATAGLLLCLFFIQACSSFRTELYREETLHRYREACKCYQRGEYEAARTGFENVIAIDPEYGPAHAALGNLALIGENYSGAMAHYRAAVAVDPELETDLQPLIMVALAQLARAPLEQAGTSLAAIYPLMMEARMAALEDLLAKDISLPLLARDTLGITPGRLGELQQKAAALADPMRGSIRLRLFLGYLLFAGRIDDALATAMIVGAVAEAERRDQKEAYIVIGQLYERQGAANAAVDAYLAAVGAGLPLTAVAHHLARIYQVDMESILPSASFPDQDNDPHAPMRVEMSTFIPALQPKVRFPSRCGSYSLPVGREHRAASGFDAAAGQGLRDAR
jgi:Tfp pilus assembly protein PilF